jgi:PhnB protein
MLVNPFLKIASNDLHDRRGGKLMASVNPYLFFDGNAKEAMEFYAEVFGAELHTMGYDDMAGESEVPVENAGRLMHADVWVGNIRVFASDSPVGFDRTPFGNPELCISAEADEEADARGWFDALAAGGNVRQPLEKMFWGDHFGQLVDKFGVQWMVNISAPAAAQDAS